MEKKKKTVEPARTRQLVDSEYNLHAANYGHKMALIQECKAQIKTYRGEVANHLARLSDLRAEAKALEANQTPAQEKTA